MFTLLSASRSFAYTVAKSFKDNNHSSRKNSAAALLFASESGVKVALEAVQALGGNGYSTEYEVERLLRDAKLYAIGAGTNEIRRMLIGRELFHGRS